ncbi:hypothetical protein ACI8AV_00965 [Geodermatophilus sp. SYSU D00804]
MLLVCTGNICRSAFAERLGRAYLEGEFGKGGHPVRLVSAGTQAVVGSAMHPATALVLRGFGGDPSRFVAQQLRADMITQADLVLGLTRVHRNAVRRLVPSASGRTFTLLEAADLVSKGAVILSPALSDAGQQTHLGGRLATSRPLRRGAAGDVPDPIGRPVEFHQQVGEQIAAALLPLLGHLAHVAGRRTSRAFSTERDRGSAGPLIEDSLLARFRRLRRGHGHAPR